MGGKYFTVLCIVSWNGYGINITAFVDIRVNSFAFINTACANNIAKFLNIKATQLKKPV